MSVCGKFEIFHKFHKNYKNILTGLVKFTIPVSILFSCFFYAVPVFATSTLIDGITAFWTLDEASGARADSVGNNDLVPNYAGAGQTDGQINTAVHFTATSYQFASTTDSADMSMGAGVRFTFAGWFYLDSSTGTQTILAKRDSVAGVYEYVIFYYGTDQKVYFKVSPTANGASEATVKSGVVSSGQWVFFTAWYNGTNINISINDGTPVSTAFSSDAVDSTAHFGLGAQADNVNGTNRFNGAIDAVGLWKRALTTAEITELYNSGVGLEYPFSPPTAPTLTTQVASSVDVTSATANGTITATGGQNATDRGFQYGLTTGYGSTASTTGSFGTGAFTGSLTGLACNTLYHYRSFATNPSGTAYGSDQSFTTSACLNSVTISTPVAYQVIQRNGSNQASISITGTYAGTPTAIEASWNGGAYTTIVASPSGGTFSGTLSGQTAGQGTLTVRFTNDNTVSDTVIYLGIGDIFVIAGQSNASGRGTSNQAYSHASLRAVEFGNDDVWKELADPVDSSAGQVDAVSDDSCGTCGSAWPLVSTLFLADQSVPVAFVPTAMGGTTIEQWQPGASHSNAATLYGSMYRRITAVGGSVKAVLFWHGESDAINGTVQATYKTKLVNLADNIFSDFGVKMITAQVGESAPASAANLQAIRLAQLSAWDDNGNVLPGPAIYDVDIGDPYHFVTNGELQLVANRWWATIEKNFYSGSDGRGPVLSTAEYNTAKTQVTLTFTDDTFPLLPADSIGGFVVKDNGTPVSISTAERIDNNKIRITLASAASGTITVSLGAGRDGNGASVPTDSGAYNLPADIFVDHAVTAMSAPSGGSVTYTDGYRTSASVSLTVADGSSGAGINTATRIVQRATSTLALGSCGAYSSFGNTPVSGTYPNFTDSTASSGYCYKYQYLVSDNDSNQATYTSSNVAKIDTASPTAGDLAFSAVDSTNITVSSTGASDGNALAVSPYQFRNVTAGTYSSVTSSSWTSSSLTPETSYNFEVGVKDMAGNWATSTVFATTTLAAPVLESDVTAPSLSGGSSLVTLQVTTNEASTCKYGTTANTAYDSIENTFNTTGGTTHAQTITGVNGMSYYVRCRDGSGNTNATDQIITISVASAVIGSGGGGGGSFSIAPTVIATGNSFLDNLIAQAQKFLTNKKATIGISMSASSNAVSTISRNLTFGMKGQDVKTLQTALVSTGYLGPGNDTGYFGSLTRTALASYQKAKNIVPAVGYFGPITKVSFVSTNTDVLSPIIQTTKVTQVITKPLSLGVYDLEVALMQQVFKTLPGIYPEGLTSGYFGEQTLEALKKFQLEYGIVSSVNDVGYGNAGPKTRAKLNEIIWSKS